MPLEFLILHVDVLSFGFKFLLSLGGQLGVVSQLNPLKALKRLKEKNFL